MADDLRKLIADGEKLGFTYAGQAGRGGHIQFVHTESGQRITASCTPGDSYAWINTRKDMERLSGKQLPRDGKAKYTFKKVECMNLHQSEVEIRNAEEVDQLVSRADGIRSEFTRLIQTPSRSSAHRARALMEEYQFLQEELAIHHRIIDPIY